MRDFQRDCEVLRGVLPQGDRLTAITPLTTGFSNETYLLEGCGLILRLPPAAAALAPSCRSKAAVRRSGGVARTGAASCSESPMACLLHTRTK